ncbi:CVNH domain-containing protein [Xylariaceae sp. FL0662B]|nr:CVNH domain-containing protein [Xylariaceae sp. FL0662B]
MFSITTLVTFGSMLAGAMASPLLTTTRATNDTASGRLDGFTDTCRRYTITQDGPNAWILAYCRDKGGLQWHSVLNLNHCIANDNGHMNPRQDGGFAASCHDLYLHSDLTMTATCDGGDGSPASVFLNDFINNDDGELICFDRRGCARDSTGCDDKPPQK